MEFEENVPIRGDHEIQKAALRQRKREAAPELP